MAKTIAIMQPYFFPYAGYFRLFAAADVFVVYDCVQFQRRGRIHRSQIGADAKSPIWLTLPIEYCDRSTRISDVRFVRDARAEFERRVAKVPWIASATGPCAGIVRDHLLSLDGSLADYLTAGLTMISGLLEFKAELVRSSDLGIDPALKGQERIIEIVRIFRGDRYVNAPGGRALYDEQAFGAAEIELEFLLDYKGRFPNMLRALLTEERADICTDIRSV